MPTRINSLSLIRGLSSKRACIVATTGNISFTGITEIDGVLLSNDDRILVWQQSTPSQNGIYVVSGSTNLVRAVDSRNISDYAQGTQFFVFSGNTYAETLFYVKNKITTLNVDAIDIDIFAGLNGTSGSSGSSGSSGTSATSGSSGSSGTSGSSATSGSSGTSGSNAGITSYTNPADNRVLTSVSSTSINAEANLVFDGTNLGIGTTSPTYKLDVSGTGRFADNWGATASNPFLIIERVGSAVSSAIGYDNVNTGMYFGTTTNHKLALRTNNTDVLVLANTGAATFNSSVTANSLSLTTPLSVANGGTGQSTLAAAGIVTGTGTTNYIPKFTGTSAIGNSAITDDGTTLSYGSNVASIGATNTSEKYLQFNFTAGNFFVGGTNAVHYIYGAGSKPITFFTNSAERMRLNASGNLGLGVTPSAWSVGGVLQVANTTGTQPIASSGIYNALSANLYYNAGWKYATTGNALLYSQEAGVHAWYNAISGTADNAVTLTQAMTLDASGRLGIGTTSPQSRTHITFQADSDGLRIQNSNRGHTYLITTAGTSAEFFSIYDVDNAQYLYQSSNDYGHGFLTGGVARMAITGAGNVGIGTTSPQTTLEINGGNTYFPSKIVTLSGAENTRYNGFIGLNLINGSQIGMSFGTRSNNIEYNNTLNLYNGNVGIGTTSPQSKLDVITSGYSYAISPLKGTGMNLVGAAGSGVGGGDQAASGVLNIIDNAPMGINNGGTITLGGNYITSGNAYSLTYAGIKGGKENGTNYNSAGYLAFYTTPSGEIPSERMRITSGGNVGIGTASPTYQLQLSTDSAGKPNGGSWANSSDIRLKENIKTIENAIDKICKLRGVTFDWIDETEQGGIKHSGGFIADEIIEIFPEWVTEVNATEKQKEVINDDKVKSLSLPFSFDALLVQAIKELSAEIDIIKQEIINLKNK